MPDQHSHWRALIQDRLRGRPLEDEVVAEIAEHLDEMHRTGLSGGRDAAAIERDIDEELANLPALIRAATASRRQRQAPPPMPPPPARPVRSFLADLLYGLRVLRAAPAFTLLVVITLALGIGANTAVFSVIHTLYLRPLPFPDPDRLVMVWEVEIDDPGAPFIVSAPNWQDWRRQATSFEEMGIWELLRFNLAGEGEPAQYPGMRVSAGLFRVLGLTPQLGRVFTESEDAPGHNVVVIGDRVWRARYGADPGIIGRSIRVNGTPHEVIGVMPEAFVFESPQYQVWVPIAFNANDADRDSHSFRAAARLKPGISFEAARAELDAIGRALERQHEENRGETATITSMRELGVGFMRPTLYTMLGAVMLVVLIACVNVANLLLARAASRQREFAIRAALGASRGRLVSQLLAEGIVLALAGGALGIGLAWLATAALHQAFPPAIRLAPFRLTGAPPIQPAILLFTLGLSVVTGVLFSLAPILGVARRTPSTVLRSGGDRGGTAAHSSLRTALVAAEVALAVVILAGAGLMIKSVSRLLGLDPGLDAAHVVVMEMALPQPDFYGPAIRTSFCQDLERELRVIPGVEHAGAISHLPLSGANAGRGIVIEGRPVPTPDDGASASYRLTCPGYFASLGIPILRGRDFSHADATGAPGVVIVNEEMARRYWPDQDPVGRRLKQGASEDAPWLTVVGVVRDVRHFGLDQQFRREMFRPYPQAAWPQMTVTVKAGGDPMAIVPSVRERLRRIEPDTPITRVRRMTDVVQESIGQRRFPTMLLGVFAVIALVLAAIGVYGVVSYVVSQRTREIGIRMALGAQAQTVVALVVARALWPIGVGLTLGAVGAVISGRLLGTLLYDVRPGDPLVLGTIVLLLGGSALAASLVPARRAARVDPLEALKSE